LDIQRQVFGLGLHFERTNMKWIIRAAALAAASASCGFQIGCGGSNSGAPSTKATTPDSTVTSVTVVATPSAITAVQTSTCVATVKGTGSFSTAVTWTATGGTITPSGVFTPSGAGNGTCKAASAQSGYSTISGSADITITNPQGNSPQGVYSGTSSRGSSFEALVLPDNSFWALYGTTSGNTFFVEGVMQGNGSYTGNNYSASGLDYYYLDPQYVYAFSVNATFVPGSSINGTVTDSASGTSSFNAKMMLTSSFNYDATPTLSDIAGSWNGALLGNVPANASIQSDGTFAGSSQGCNFSVSITPDPSGHNFFDVTITYGSGSCYFPGVTQTGIAVDYVLSDGTTRQLVAAVHDSGHGNNVFIANR
jgi:hypothetical protein